MSSNQICVSQDRDRTRRPASAVSGNVQRRRLQEALQASETDLRADTQNSAATWQAGGMRAKSAGHISRRSLRPPSAPPVRGNSSAVLETRIIHKPKRDATAGVFIKTVSPMTWTQNEKTEEFEARVAEFMDSRTKVESPTERRASVVDEPIAEAFRGSCFDKDLKEFQETLAHMGRRIRMENFTDAKMQKRKEEDWKKAEEKRKLDEAQRKLRQAAKEAQNPKRRVALRVEQQRLASDADINEGRTRVRMKRMQVKGGYESHKIQLVDVQLLQNQCVGLNVGSKTFDTIYELWRLHDSRKRKEEESRVHQSDETGAESQHKESIIDYNRNSIRLMSRTAEKRNEKIAEWSQSYEEKCIRAQTRRLEEYQKKASQQLSAMRNSTTLNQDVFSTSFGTKTLKEISSAVAEAREPGTMSRKSSANLSATLGGINESSESPERSSVSGRSTRPYWWGVLRGVVAFISLLNRQRRTAKNAAADDIRRFLETLECIRVFKDGCRRLKKKVIRLQDECRATLMRKRQWVLANTPLWTNIEDQYLQKYSYKTNALEAHASSMGSSRRGNSSFEGDPFEPQRKRASFLLDISEKWQALRIPASHRKVALGRWYFGQLRKKVERQKLWLETKDVGMKQRKEMQQFFDMFKGCGVDFEDTEHAPQKLQFESIETVRVVQPKDMFKLAEQDVLELIMMVAHELLDHDTHGVTFQRHWACSGRSRGMSSTNRFAKQLNTNLIRRATVQSTDSETTVTGPEEQTESEDLDELFRRFTPRLREIREAPATLEVGADFVAEPLPTL